MSETAATKSDSAAPPEAIAEGEDEVKKYLSNGIDRHDLVQVQNALMTYQLGEDPSSQPPLFLKDGVLVLLKEDKRLHTFTTNEVKEGTLRLILSTPGDWYQLTARGEAPGIPKPLLQKILDGAGSSGKFDYIRTLAGIHDGVMLDDNWNVIHTKGYDEKTQLYFTKSYELEPVPLEPTEEDINGFKDLLWDIFREFKFRDKSGRESVDYQNTVLALITVVIRQMWGDNALPDIVDIKPSERSGASLHQTCIGVLAYGEIPPKSSCRNDKRRDHYESMIESALISGDKILFIDNVPDGERYSTPRLLQHSVNNGHVKIRKYGTQELKDCPPKTTVMANGIDLLVTADDTGRIIPVYIVPEKIWQETKYERDETELIELCIKKHPEVIRGIAMLHRYWINKGCPMTTSVKGNFKAYPKLMKSVLPMLYCAGYKKVLSNLEEVQGSDNQKEDETRSIIMAIKSWSDITKTESNGEFTTGQLASKVLEEAHDRNRDSIPGMILPYLPEDVYRSAMKSEKSLHSSLGTFLKKLKGKKAYGCEYQLVQVMDGEGKPKTDDNNSKYYKIEHILKQEELSTS